MKIKIQRFVALAALSGLMACTPLALGQEKKADNAAPRPPQGQRADRLQQMADQLQLTEEQKNQIKPILKEQSDKMRELRNDTAMSREDRQAKMKTMREDMNAKMKKILKPEQYEKWEKQAAQRGQRRPQGGAPAAPATPPPASPAK